MTGRAARAALIATWVFAALLVVFSNHLDWDAFYAFAEVERRSWLLDHELPLWTYQLCGGMSRAGDPQAFGLSPLFVLVLVFGSFWGNKLLVLLGLAAGGFYTARILERFHAPAPGVANAPYPVLATLFVLGNYFVWHLLVGHVTFIDFLLALGIVHYTLEGYLRRLSRRELALGTLLAWQHYSGAFFHSLVYFLLPFLLAFALFVVADRGLAALRRRESGPALASRLLRAGGFHGLGIALAGYKLWAVADYFRGIERKVWSPPETLSAAQVSAQLLIPTWHSGWLLPAELGSLWGVHEYSAFSWLVPLALVALAVAACGRFARERAPTGGDSLALLAGLYLGVALCFSMGEFARFAPLTLLNRLEPGGTVRAIGRFQVGVVLAVAMGLMRLLRRPACARLVGPLGCLVLLAALDLNLASFLPLTSAQRLAEILALPYRSEARMRGWEATQIFRPPRDADSELRSNTSRMYAAVRSGQALASCYNELPLPPSPPNISRRGSIPLIDARIGAPSAACTERSYFTQNRVFLDASCPPLTCTNVARVNPRQREPVLTQSAEHDRYCRAAAS